MPSTQEEFTLPLRPRDTAENTLSDAQGGEADLLDDQEDDPTQHHVNFFNHPNAVFRTYEMNVGVPTIRNLWLYNFQELRSSDKSRDFSISHKKIPVIMRKIKVARRRFLDSDADMTSIPAEFFNFLHPIDHFIFKIESTFQTNVTKHLKKKHSRDESDDETEEIQNTMKKARIAIAYEEIEKMAQEEQIRYWKEMALGLKNKLEAKDEVVKGLHKLLHEMKDRKNRSSLEFNYCITRLWDDALPKIDEKQRKQGQTEWASSQL
ncbi:uncharacterized protein CCOS01_09484 [Colletotrichum costaricense]|uniref:Uncharacterized protein n=1 Tax=Colletotrichum costaricense TaxID=1209916 RepID=A0AAJ0DZ60_9PEZI|nr:uncharacterized protein CCOS01_09484 [Colletotrichum costaricense]KAK1524397.1 hypothetical protein CCOS01_09484 [Colletotrichum costaricense]